MAVLVRTSKQKTTCAVPLDLSITTMTTSSIDVPEHETTWAEFFKLNILWIMLMMYLGYAQWMLQRANQETEKCSSWRCRVAERCVNNNEQQCAYAHGSGEVGSHCAKQGGCHAHWKMLPPCILPHHQRQQYPNIASLGRVPQPLWVNVSTCNFNPHLCLPASRACAWVCV